MGKRTKAVEQCDDDVRDELVTRHCFLCESKHDTSSLESHICTSLLGTSMADGVLMDTIWIENGARCSELCWMVCIMPDEAHRKAH